MTTPWVDDRTLDEMATTDAEMLDRCYKKADRFEFNDKKTCENFVIACLDATLNKCGVNGRGKSYEQIQELCKQNDVRIEHRIDYEEDEIWKRGFYVYKNSELIVFVSHPFVDQSKLATLGRVQKIIRPSFNKPFAVYTNAKVVTSKFII